MKNKNLIIVLFLTISILFLVFNLIRIFTHKEYIDVADFGANGHDNIDDTDAINSALSSFKYRNKYLYFSDGKYIVKNLKLPSNIHVIGESESTILQTSNTSSTWDKLIYLDNVKNVTIESITFDGNIEEVDGNTEEGVFLLKIDNCKDIKVINSKFQNNKYCSIVSRGVQNILIDSCKFINTDVGVGFMDASAKRGTISNNYFDGGTSEAIALYGRFDGYNEDIDIYNNSINNKNMHGIHIRQSKNINCYNNNIYNCGTGITIEKYNDYECENISIKNNTINTTKLEGINVKSSNVSIESNEIIKSGENGILMLNVDNVIIQNNKLEDYNALNEIEGQGIHAEDITNCLLENNNFILNNISNILSKSHIFISGLSKNNKINNNNFSPDSLDPIHDFSK